MAYTRREMLKWHICTSDMVDPTFPSPTGVTHATLPPAMKWRLGQRITICFLGGRAWQHRNVKLYASEWLAYANLRFDWVVGPRAHIRISFVRGPSWSNIGRQPSTTGPATMNFGWINSKSSDTDIQRIILHEFGHALGLFHEHKPRKLPLRYIADNTNFDLYYLLEAGLRIPGTTPTPFLVNREVSGRLLPKFNRGQTQYSSFDSKSIMVYDIDPKLTRPPYPVRKRTGDLSHSDRFFMAQTLYPYPTPLYPRPIVRVFPTSLIPIPNQRNFSLSQLYSPPAGFQIQKTGPSNSGRLPGLCLNALILSPTVFEILVRPIAVFSWNDQYRVEADCWRSYTPCDGVGVTWLELPTIYPQVQWGHFDRPVYPVPGGSMQNTQYDIQFGTHFKTIPKVVVFFSKLYVNRSAGYNAAVSVANITESQFTLIISTQAAGVTPNTMWNFEVAWIAYPANAPFVDSGEVVSRGGSLSNSGRVTFRKVFRRRPRVFAGPSRLGLQAAVGPTAKFAVTKNTTTRRRFDWESGLSFNNATVRGNWIAFG